MATAANLGVVATPPRAPTTVSVKQVSILATENGKQFALPKQLAEAKDHLLKKGAGPAQADMDLRASLQINGGDAEEVAQTVESTTVYFQEFIHEVEGLTSRPVKLEDAEALKDRLTSEFQHNVKDMLENDPRHAFVRQNSISFVETFNRAESLLEHGAQGYIDTVRKLVTTGDNVTIVLKDLSFVEPTSHLADKKAASSSSLRNALMWPVRKLTCSDNNGYARVGNASEMKFILKNVTTLLKPGRLTLVLGPPGSSKSSFLKALSGNLLHVPGKAKMSGKLEYNGHDVAKLQNLAAWVSYVTQTDDHMPLLTVRETMEFAWKCRREPIFSQYPDNEKFRALKQVEIDIILATLGLAGCKDTYIGDATLKGVSGGEKRRVTLGEKLVTGSPVLALDEISTGLDASTTYDIVAHLANVARLLGQTIVVALLQPPPEVIALCDDIICLAEGQVIYHGPREFVLEYFEDLGFHIPERMELGDFLQTLPTKGGLKYFNKPDSHAPRTADDFSRLWRASPMFREEEQEINALLGKQGRSLDQTPQLGFFSSLALVSTLTMRLRLRQTAQIAARVFSNVVMGFFYGSLFWQLDGNESYLKSMLLFQIPSFVFSSAFPNVQVMCKQKPVFLKQLDASFYSAKVFTFSQFLTSLPFICFDILCFGNIVYWATGLANRAETYAMFLALMMVYAVAMNTAFAVFPFLAAKEDASIMLAVFFLLMCFLNSGMIATPDIVPDYVIWLFWLDPLAWILRALSINEYHSGGQYDQNPCSFEILGHKLKVNERCGDYFLKMRQIRTEDYWIYACFVFMGVFTLLSLLLSFYAVGSLRFEEERSERVKKVDDEPEAVDTEEGDVALRARPMMRRQDSVSIPRQQLCVRDLWYTVNVGGEDIDFLKGISFHTTPGRCIALMGSSGAGKTTLMDVIAGRKTTGKWRGDILVDGVPKVQSEFIKYAAYVEQFGSHIPSATVLESLRFSAEMRLPASVSQLQRTNFIQENLEILELEEIQHSLCAGLSMEQNKRLTLGVELVANPSILFADEPTSSLDARAAALVMRVLTKIAQSGRTVICTIHQPSAEVFLGFDDLLLLKRGGEIVFFGEIGSNARNLIDYFEKIPGTTPCPPQANPGTWMLEILGAGTTGAGTVDAEGNRVDFAAAYKRSSLKRMNDEILNQITQRPKRMSFSELSSPALEKMKEFELAIRSSYVRSLGVQVRMLLARSFQAYWRTASFTLARYIVAAVIAIIFSLIFWQQPLKNVADVQSRVILLYFFVGILSMYNLYTIIPFAMARLPVFYRERATGMYSIVATVLADSIVEIPFVFLQIAMAGGYLYVTVGMNPDFTRAAYYLTNVFIVVYLLTMIGLLFSALLPDPLSAQLSAISFVQILQIFSGVLVPEQHLPKPYKPFYYASPYMWSTEGIVATQFHGDDSKMCAPFGELPTGKLLTRLGLCTSDGSNELSKVSGVVTTVQEFALVEFLPDFDFENRYRDLGVLVLWTVAVRLVLLLTMVFVNHNKR